MKKPQNDNSKCHENAPHEDGSGSLDAVSRKRTGTLVLDRVHETCYCSLDGVPFGHEGWLYPEFSESSSGHGPDCSHQAGCEELSKAPAFELGLAHLE